jgi:serine/threonine protein kinase
MSQLSPLRVKIFQQEVSLMWKLQRHPNVAKFVGWSESPAAILMQYYRCGDLRHFIMRGSDQLDYHKTNIISVMLQISSAISYMHREGIAHCDIKSANILLEFDPVKCTIIAVITDFGIARILDLSSVKIEAFEVANVSGISINYAAPEAISRYRMRFRETNPRTFKAGDVFSLAIVLLEMMVRGDAWDLQHRQRYGLARPTYNPATEMPHY